jgi:flagellar biosynthetic protein FliR
VDVDPDRRQRMNVNQLLAQFSERDVAGFFLVLGRISPLFLLAPLFSSKMIPARARTVVALALAVGIAPLAMHGVHAVPLDEIGFAALMLKEILVGLLFSFAVGAVFAALAAAGSIADSLVGFSFGSVIDPVFGNQGGTLSQVYSLVGLTIFVVINGDAWVIEGLARSYDAVPLLSAPDITSLSRGAQVAFSGILGAAVEVCAPVLLAMLLTDAALGLTARVMPQLNVFAVGFPAKVAVGVLIVGASLPFVGGWVSESLQTSVAQALHSLKVA